MEDLIFAALTRCMLCPRRCGIDRIHGQTGRCNAGETVLVARAALHPWEEPCISGDRGSGTVFFSHCSLGCVFCQNHSLSQDGNGIPVEINRLSEIFLELQAAGAHNINLVTPTHYAPQIIEAVKRAKTTGLFIPIVYNCGGYELPETVKMLHETVDVWLPDFKYAQTKPAFRYSAAADYPEQALSAIAAMVEMAGTPRFGEDGLLKSGVLVRHLLLPGLLADSLQAIALLAERFEGKILLSLMSQFTPMPGCSKRFPELMKPVNPRHYEALCEFAVNTGAFDCYTQEPSAADSAFIPSFLGQGVLPER